MCRVLGVWNCRALGAAGLTGGLDLGERKPGMLSIFKATVGGGSDTMSIVVVAVLLVVVGG